MDQFFLPPALLFGIYQAKNEKSIIQIQGIDFTFHRGKSTQILPLFEEKWWKEVWTLDGAFTYPLKFWTDSVAFFNTFKDFRTYVNEYGFEKSISSIEYTQFTLYLLLAFISTYWKGKLVISLLLRYTEEFNLYVLTFRTFPVSRFSYSEYVTPTENY